jgi:hypothetical protein
MVMVRKFGMVCGLGLALLMSVGSAHAFGLVGSPAAAAEADVHDVSFFGRPYPYGYTGWGPCIRYVEVPTRHGVRVRRVWACR